MKNYLVGFAIAIIAAASLYFFYIVPEQGRVRKEINAAYDEGYKDCFDNIDTVFVPSKPKIVYRDTTIYVEKPAKVTKPNDSVYVTASSIDTAVVSGRDTIGIKATVGIKFNINSLIPSSEWFMQLEHKDFVKIPDTVVVKVPKIIKETIVETNWLYVLISFIGGSVLTILAVLL